MQSLRTENPNCWKSYRDTPEERYAPVVFPQMDMLYICEGLSG